MKEQQNGGILLPDFLMCNMQILWHLVNQCKVYPLAT